MDEKIISIAAERLGVSEDVAKEYNKPVPEINGWSFWTPGRGGSRILINADGETLAAGSGLLFEKHVELFVSGRRN